MAETEISKRRNVLRRVKIASLAVVIFLAGLVIGQGDFSRGALNQASANKGLPEDLDYSSVEQLYDELKKNYDGALDKQKLLDGLKEGLVKASDDPYTEYFNAEGAEDFNEQLNGSFSGIGAELSKENGDIVVVSPIAGFPAEKAGIKPKDIIAEVDGGSTADMTVSEAVSKIRGEKGTKVKLTIIRGAQPLSFEVTREDITIPSVKSEIVAGNIGYLQISRYSEDTVRLATEAAKQYKANNVSGVVLDLRGNPGGLLDAAVGLSSLWLKDGAKVLEEKRDGKVIKTYSSDGNDILQGVKTIVLINEGSASASEITAGALKDNGVAQLVGVKSYGKGSVQSLLNLGSSLLPGGKEGLLKVTIARWYTPKGKNIDKEGISPDVEVQFSAEDAEAGRDPQKDKALELVKE